MPKSTKHKKERAADFTKAKLKLGKGKQVASNATNTSFAAKSIALPSQSLASAPKSAPTSRRNLTLPELLVQCRHYSVPTKREALNEIQQLLASYPFLLTQHLLPLTTTIAHLIPAESNSVRHAAREVLRFMCENLSHGQLVSVSAGVVLFTLSALSSLDDPVRIDALKVLDLLMSHIPEEITRGWDGSADVSSSSGAADLLGLAKEGDERGTGAKVVEALLGMLKVRSVGLQKAQGAFTTQAAGSDLSPTARLAVLTTLATFLRASLSPASSAGSSSTASTSSEPWYLSTSFTTPRAYANFLASFSSSSSASSTSHTVTPSAGGFNTALFAPIEPFSLALSPLPAPSADLSLSSFGLRTPPLTPTSSSSSSSFPHAPPTTLLSLLHPLLLSSFLDAAPTAFSPSASLSLSTTSSARADATETVEAVLSVARELFHRALGGASPSGDDEKAGAAAASGTVRQRRESRKALVALLGHAAPYFPFGSDALPADAGKRSAADEERFLRLNLVFAELSSLVVLSEEDGGGSKGAEGKKGKGKKGDRERERKERVEGVVVERVQEWVVAALKGELTTPSHPLGLPLPPSSFRALEPTLWSLLNQQDPTRAVEVWDAVLGLFVRGGAARREGWEFAARVVLLQSDPSYLNRFDLSSTLSPSSPAGEVSELPKGSMLARWFATVPKWLWEMGGKDERATELVLTFLLKLAQQGLKGVLPPSALTSLPPLLHPFFHLLHPTRGSMPGPFTRLPPPVQAKAMDLALYLSSLAAAAGGQEERAKAKALREAVGRAVEACADEGVAKARWEMLQQTGL
ncbi:hypothetical protein JCM6882_006634 [Rhodosporidiobolus microsporus]